MAAVGRDQQRAYTPLGLVLGADGALGVRGALPIGALGAGGALLVGALGVGKARPMGLLVATGEVCRLAASAEGAAGAIPGLGSSAKSGPNASKESSAGSGVSASLGPSAGPAPSAEVRGVATEGKPGVSVASIGAGDGMLAVEVKLDELDGSAAVRSRQHSFSQAHFK